jgi:hypothetical protein
MNIAQLSKSLGWKINKKEYHHLLVLIKYLPLNDALKLMLNKEASNADKL